MAESKKSTPPPEPPALAAGATASNPTVHRLLAERTALAKWDADDEAAIAAAKAGIESRKAAHAAIDAQLAELGYQ